MGGDGEGPVFSFFSKNSQQLLRTVDLGDQHTCTWSGEVTEWGGPAKLHTPVYCISKSHHVCTYMNTGTHVHIRHHSLSFLS